MKVDHIIAETRRAKNVLQRFTAEDRNRTLQALAETLEQDRAMILEANALDLAQVKMALSDADIDRMTLSDGRFDELVNSVKEIAGLTDMVGQIYGTRQQLSGVVTSKMRVPIGAILMIYESRPNVTIDAAALAIKTGNAIILKGGHEAAATNTALGHSIAKALKNAGMPAGAVSTLAYGSHSLTAELLGRDESIDLIIPRGSRRLLEFVQQHSVIPTLRHLDGNCHIYIDKAADIRTAVKLVVDAKTQRFGTCNTAESLLLHRASVSDVLPSVASALRQRGVTLRGDETVCKMIQAAETATEADWSQEYLAPMLSIKVVDSLDAAVSHINRYGSRHTDAIITEDSSAAAMFLRDVDSASVLHNTSTRLADGCEYGLGAEIGISTGKLHARGPVGQDGLLTYKWIVRSNGVTKSDIVNVK
jgi:glutamate-5-semialdehyde dehydrogenase